MSSTFNIDLDVSKKLDIILESPIELNVKQDSPQKLNIQLEPPYEINVNQEASRKLAVQLEAPIELQAVQRGLALGADGRSAYEVWLAKGNEGTEQDFLDSLKGETGDTLWEAETATTIRPMESKKVDAMHLTGEVFGGLFQP